MTDKVLYREYVLEQTNITYEEWLERELRQARDTSNDLFDQVRYRGQQVRLAQTVLEKAV